MRIIKLFTLTFACCILLLLVACGGNKTGGNSKNDPKLKEPPCEKQQDNRKNESETNFESSCLFLPNDSLLKIKDTIIIAGGVVQTSGIHETDELEVEAEYQLVSTKKSFYLITGLDFSTFWGRCVCVKGTLAEGWDLTTIYFNGNYTFGRTALNVTSVSLADDEICNQFLPLIDPSRTVKQEPLDTLHGVLVRTSRPAPDISYDYALQLSEPISHPEEPTYKLNQIIIHLDIPLEKRNELIENQTEIKVVGRMTVEYAEMYVFIATLH